MTLSDWASRWNIPSQAMQELCQITGIPSATVSGTSEAATQNQIRLVAPQHDCVMWRNNSGACKDDTGRLIRYGLGNDSARLNKVWKSPDLVGIRYDGRFVGCEVKRPGWTKPENDRDRAQLTCLTQINAHGGIGFFATSVQDWIRNVLR